MVTLPCSLGLGDFQEPEGTSAKSKGSGPNILP